MMNFRLTLTAFFFSFFASSLHALDLLEAYNQALIFDAGYQRQIQLKNADKQLVPQARSLLLPNLNVTAHRAWRDDRLKQDDNLISDANPSNTASERDDPLTLSPLSLQGTLPDRQDDYVFDRASLNLTQTVFDRSQWANLKQSHSQVAEADFRLDDRRQDLILDVTTAYFSYLKAEDTAKVSSKEIEAVKRQQTLTEQRYSDDLGTLTDVYEARSRLELADVDIIDAKNDQLAAIYELEKLTGLPVNNVAALEDDYQFSDIDSEISVWVEQAMQQSHSIQLAKQQLETAELELKKQRSGHWPTLQLRGESSIEENEFSAVSNDDSTYRNELLLELAVPLFSGFGVRAQVKEAAYRYTAAQENLRNVQLESEREVRTRHANAKNAYRRLNKLKQAYDDSRAALDLREQGYLEGLSTNLDLLDTYRDTFRAERDWRRARYDYLLAVLQLKRASHNIQDTDIEQINSNLIKQPD